MPYFIGITLLLEALCSFCIMFNIIEMPFDFEKVYWFFCLLSLIPTIYYTNKETEHKSVTFIMTLLFSLCAYAFLFLFGGLAIIGLGSMLCFVGLFYLFSERNKLKPKIKTFLSSINWCTVWFVLFFLSLILNLILISLKH